LDSGGDSGDDLSFLEVEELNIVDCEATIVSYRHDTREIQAVGAFANVSAAFGIDNVHIETVHLNAVDHAILTSGITGEHNNDAPLFRVSLNRCWYGNRERSQYQNYLFH
jgi:hypothetical protein